MADTSFNGDWVKWDLEKYLKFPRSIGGVRYLKLPRSIGGVAYLKLLRIYGVRYLKFPHICKGI